MLCDMKMKPPLQVTTQMEENANQVVKQSYGGGEGLCMCACVCTSLWRLSLEEVVTVRPHQEPEANAVDKSDHVHCSAKMTLHGWLIFHRQD